MDKPHSPDHADHVTSAPPPVATSEAEAAPPPPMTVTGWIVNNFLYVLLLFFVGWLLYKGGMDWLLRAGMVVVGLGFVIFIHELGHFLAAKWCDVHVQTFSIGFGPALPGCSFTRGETLYKIAALPLGGYVNMVGEGPEADEDENYPRSFKNKTVLQRMLIISAGVIMNVLFGALCFVVVYLYHGVDRPTAVMYRVDSGSQAWIKGVRPGWQLVEVAGKKDPFFDDMQAAVALSGQDRKVSFRFQALPGTPEAPSEPIEIVPHRDANNTVPVIGVSYPNRLTLAGTTMKRSHSMPVNYSSASAFARSLALKPGDVPLASTEPEKGKLTDLPAGAAAWAELASRLRESAGGEFVVRVKGEGGERDVTAGAGFDFGDAVVATTNPATPDQPFNIEPLSLDPNHPPEKQLANPFEYRRRMVKLSGKPVVIQVRRSKGKETDLVELFVPPAYNHSFGMRMRMGKVAAIRERSPAEKAGLQKDDVITRAEVSYDGGSWEALPESALDPVRLPDALYRHIHQDASKDASKWRVRLTVQRSEDHKGDAKQVLEPMAWDDTWVPGDEAPVTPASPMSIPQLGIAYWVDSTIAEVVKDSPADKAGLQKGDELRRIRIRNGGKTPDEKERSWSSWDDLNSIRGNAKPYDQWAHHYWLMQRSDFPIMEAKVFRNNAALPNTVELTGVADETWPLAERGLLFTGDRKRQKADTFIEAVKFGLADTWSFIERIYLNLTRLLSGRISAKSLGGPIEIASQAFMVAGEDIWLFLLFLGIISINLAVVNFLPIPVLDGGHMVFLIYEGIRGKPPSETIRIAATYFGLLLILSLMLFVFYVDLRRRGWLPWQ